MRDGLDLPERRHDDAFLARDQLECPCRLGFGEQHLQETTGIEIQGHRHIERGLLVAFAPQQVVGPRLRRLGLPESPQPRRMLLGIESLSRRRSWRAIGENARHRLRIPRDDDLPLVRQDALGFRPFEAHVSDGHRRHGQTITCFTELANR